MNTSLCMRLVALSLALSGVALSGCDRRPADTTATPSAMSPLPVPPASAASR
jgi:hypothetical protein